ncbi:F0F1 ATP synthase subunit epsilon [Rhabdaerophilum sp. SD176]|uniref:F0F1 ATP synthase subunit epsilon n=1 Tax=Rhabdaerophilum sp. SD176 TaxID=2983548 RepID=UPI0024DF7F92|nr:F0F1 ATP synthase subunit epsilon [Rhabdaerophilum sp. SD176]
MATFPFELVSPERVLFSGEATQVVVPASEGEITVLANHAPFMSALRSGVVTIDNGQRLFVRGGFADVSQAGLTVLAEQAVPLDEINPEALSGQIRNAEEDLRDAKTDEARTRAQAKLDGLNAMMAAIRN